MTPSYVPLGARRCSRRAFGIAAPTNGAIGRATSVHPGSPSKKAGKQYRDTGDLLPQGDRIFNSQY